jgi:beta-glucosidase
LLTKDRDGFIWGKLREVAHYYLYTMSRSNLVNGLSKTETVANYTPWWKPALVGLNAAIGILTAGTAVL